MYGPSYMFDRLLKMHLVLNMAWGLYMQGLCRFPNMSDYGSIPLNIA